jgi:hypothetical protein
MGSCMSEYPDHDRVRGLLKRIDEITQESERIRQQIEAIRGISPEWPDRRRTSRLFQDRPQTFPNTPSKDTK